MNAGNLFSNIPQFLSDELFESLVERDDFRLERIVSRGHTTAPGEWFDQPRDEWVVLLSGSAGLLIEGEAEPRELHPGDWLLLPAHLRHRVEWTDQECDTVWLALHF